MFKVGLFVSSVNLNIGTSPVMYFVFVLMFLSIVYREVERLSLLEASAKSAKKGMWDKESPHVRLNFELPSCFVCCLTSHARAAPLCVGSVNRLRTKYTNWHCPVGLL